MNNPGLLFPIDQPLRKILDFLPYPFLISEFRNGVLTHVYFNNPFIDEIGYTLEEMPTINEWYTLAYPEEDYRTQIKKEWDARVHQSLTDGDQYAMGRAKVHTKDNGYIWFEIKAAVFVKGYHFVSFVNVDDVITQDEQLRQANQNKNKMLSILSHDLRSTMINLNSLANMAANKNLSANEFAELAGQVKERSALALELLDTTVHWTRTNFENVKLTKQPVSVKAVALRILETDNTYRDKKIDIEIDMDDQLRPATDQGIITIIIRNLISNAIKFTPVNGRIEFKSWAEQKAFYFSLKDSGTGMDPKQVAAVLSDQYSPTTGTLREKGSGIGLTLCRDLLKKINGSLAIESKPGMGTEVRVMLPF